MIVIKISGEKLKEEFGDDVIFEISRTDKCENCECDNYEKDSEVWGLVDDLSGVCYCIKCIFKIYEGCKIDFIEVKNEKDLVKLMEKEVSI